MGRNRKWHVSTTKNKEANLNRGFCVCKDKQALLPTISTAWKVWNGGKWEDQARVSSDPLSPAEVKAIQAKEAKAAAAAFYSSGGGHLPDTFVQVQQNSLFLPSVLRSDLETHFSSSVGA